ncbi:hypothetical protein GYMLUDRAFT_63698 [Collybiopsis luxurians FD-317 M1]|uniref:Uncharacterized protein n=1 Tax=Collybiopsis luxurians FD-317 M1 TaxID=944289 RepID=A0A0D0BFK6_9AGAR|nr:hypothetical protein GYMLUDRAFT_63698 [Collybiopsis luxurians FD-317 M1]
MSAPTRESHRMRNLFEGKLGVTVIRHRSALMLRCHFRTKSVVGELVVYTIIAFQVDPANLSFLAIDFVSTTLCANSFLASLNFRQSLRQQLGSIGESADLNPSLMLRARARRERGRNWGTTTGKGGKSLDTLKAKSNPVYDDPRLCPAPKITTEVFQTSG